MKDDRGDETILFESAVILEYLEETLPHPLHPDAPLARANHRAWMEFGSACLNAIGRFYNAKDSDSLSADAQRLSDMFNRVEQELGAGPWFSGARFSLVDAVYGPVFRYFDVFDAIADFGILADKPKLRQWREHLSRRVSIGHAVADDYADRLMKFLIERHSALSEKILTQGIALGHPSMSLGFSS